MLESFGGIALNRNTVPSLRNNQWFLALQAEDILEVLKRTPPDETAAILLRVAIEPVVGIVLEEEVNILIGCIVKAVLQRDVVKERVIAVEIVGTRRDFSSNGDFQTIIPQPLGKLKRIVHMGVAGSISRVVEAEREIECAQSIAGDVINLTVQEGTQGTVHREGTGISIG